MHGSKGKIHNGYIYNQYVFLMKTVLTKHIYKVPVGAREFVLAREDQIRLFPF